MPRRVHIYPSHHQTVHHWIFIRFRKLKITPILFQWRMSLFLFERTHPGGSFLLNGRQCHFNVCVWLLDERQHFRRITANDLFCYRIDYRQISPRDLMATSSPDVFLTLKFLLSDDQRSIFANRETKREIQKERRRGSKVKSSKIAKLKRLLII